jgi:ATP-dependent helicase HrpA
MGRGRRGRIGCTQPRRIAAQSVAARVAAELDTELGDVVGYQVRFSDKLRATSAVKFMTDGILLAETARRTRCCARYDTLILDEAHERSLNIDFLLGYLKGLLAPAPGSEARGHQLCHAGHLERFSRVLRRRPDPPGLRPDVPRRRVLPAPARRRGGSGRDHSEHRRGDHRSGSARRYPDLPAGRAGDPRGGRSALSTQRALPAHGDPAALRSPLGRRSGPGVPARRPAAASSCWRRTWRRPPSPSPASSTSIDAGAGPDQPLRGPQDRRDVSSRSSRSPGPAPSSGRGAAAAPQSGVCFRLYEEEDFKSRRADHTDPELKRVGPRRRDPPDEIPGKLGPRSRPSPFLDPPGQARRSTRATGSSRSLAPSTSSGELTPLSASGWRGSRWIRGWAG